MTKKAIALCRVSTVKQAQEGESFEDQEKICNNIARSHDAEILRFWREAFSGRKEKRPVIDEIIDYIKKSSIKIDHLIIRGIDRLTRNGVIGYETIKAELSKYGVEIIDSAGIIQPSKNTLEHLGFEYAWSKYYPSGIAEMVMADNSKAEVRNILTRTIGQQIRLTQDGYHIGLSHDGFINKRVKADDGKKKTIQIPDPVRSPYLIEMFNLRASGQFSDEEIVKKINAMGFKTRIRDRWNKNHDKIIGKIGGASLTIKQLQTLIKKPIYCGIKIHKWTKYRPIKAQFDGLVSIELFNRANRGKIYVKELFGGQYEVSHNHYPERTTQKRLKNNPLFPFKFILCPKCKKPFLGSSPSGKSKKGFPTYHCARKHEYIGFSKKLFEETIKNYISRLKFKTVLLDQLEDAFINTYRKKQKELMVFSSRISKNISELKSEQAMLVETLISTKSEVAKREIEKKIDELENQILNAQTKRNETEVTERDIKEFISFGKYLMEHPAELLLDSKNMLAQRALFGLAFEEMPTYADFLNGTPKLSLIFELSRQSENSKKLMAQNRK